MPFIAIVFEAQICLKRNKTARVLIILNYKRYIHLRFIRDFTFKIFWTIHHFSDVKKLFLKENDNSICGIILRLVQFFWKLFLLSFTIVFPCSLLFKNYRIFFFRGHWYFFVSENMEPFFLFGVDISKGKWNITVIHNMYQSLSKLEIMSYMFRISCMQIKMQFNTSPFCISFWTFQYYIWSFDCVCLSIYWALWYVYFRCIAYSYNFLLSTRRSHANLCFGVLNWC